MKKPKYYDFVIDDDTPSEGEPLPKELYDMLMEYCLKHGSLPWKVWQFDWFPDEGTADWFSRRECGLVW